MGIVNDGALDDDGSNDATTDGALDATMDGTRDGTCEALDVGDNVGEYVSCNGVTAAALLLLALASSLESRPLTDLAAKNPAQMAAMIKAPSAKPAS